MLKVRSHCSRVLVNRLPPPPMPALLNSKWILSVACRSINSSRKRLRWSSIETSATWVVTRSPCGSFSTSQSRLVSAIASAETSHIATLQPSATSWRASSRPMPVPPPVTTAILPLKSFIAFLSRYALRRQRLPHRPDHRERAGVADGAAAHLVHRVGEGGARMEGDDDHGAAIAAPEDGVGVGRGDRAAGEAEAHPEPGRHLQHQ